MSEKNFKSTDLGTECLENKTTCSTNNSPNNNSDNLISNEPNCYEANEPNERQNDGSDNQISNELNYYDQSESNQDQNNSDNNNSVLHLSYNSINSMNTEYQDSEPNEVPNSMIENEIFSIEQDKNVLEEYNQQSVGKERQQRVNQTLYECDIQSEPNERQNDGSDNQISNELNYYVQSESNEDQNSSDNSINNNSVHSINSMNTECQDSESNEVPNSTVENEIFSREQEKNALEEFNQQSVGNEGQQRVNQTLYERDILSTDLTQKVANESGLCDESLFNISFLGKKRKVVIKEENEERERNLTFNQKVTEVFKFADSLLKQVNMRKKFKKFNCSHKRKEEEKMMLNSPMNELLTDENYYKNTINRSEDNESGSKSLTENNNFYVVCNKFRLNLFKEKNFEIGEFFMSLNLGTLIDVLFDRGRNVEEILDSSPLSNVASQIYKAKKREIISYLLEYIKSNLN